MTITFHRLLVKKKGKRENCDYFLLLKHILIIDIMTKKLKRTIRVAYSLLEVFTKIINVTYSDQLRDLDFFLYEV